MTKLIKQEQPTQQLATPEQIQAISTIKNAANATYAAAQEFTLVIEQVLMDQFGFTEEEIKKLHREVERILTVVRQAEGAGLNSVGIRTIKMLSEIAEIRQERERIEATGIKLPPVNQNAVIMKLLK